MPSKKVTVEDFIRVDAALRAKMGLPSLEEARRQEEERAKILRTNVRPITVIKEEVKRQTLQYVPRIRATNTSSASSSMEAQPSNSGNKDLRKASLVQKGPKQQNFDGEAGNMPIGMSPTCKDAQGKTTGPKPDPKEGTPIQNHSNEVSSVSSSMAPKRKKHKPNPTNRKSESKESKTNQKPRDGAERRISRNLDNDTESKAQANKPPLPPLITLIPKRTLNADDGTGKTPNSTTSRTSVKRKTTDLENRTDAPAKIKLSPEGTTGYSKISTARPKPLKRKAPSLETPKDAQPKRPKLKRSKPKSKPRPEPPTIIEIRSIWDPRTHQPRCGICALPIESDNHCVNGHRADTLKPRTRSGVRIRDRSDEELLKEERAGPPYRVNVCDIDSEEDTRLVRDSDGDYTDDEEEGWQGFE